MGSSKFLALAIAFSTCQPCLAANTRLPVGWLIVGTLAPDGERNHVLQRLQPMKAIGLLAAAAAAGLVGGSDDWSLNAWKCSS